ncbi:unnamed protein product [Gemmata massiliana]|uniref:Uncharacterized protein n=1 Tax=Gemmata massiliana TaxID=1210884 RepID=A0A6P2D5H3_9BACT|nr:unnamed protein product [Gemmata massiliana]
MTEAEWLACEDPSRLWLWIQNRVDWRKATRFCVACSRHAITSTLPGDVAALMDLVEQSLTQGDGRFDGYLQPLMPQGEVRMSVVRAGLELEGKTLQHAVRGIVASKCQDSPIDCFGAISFR